MTDIRSFIAFHASRPVIGLFLALGLVVTMGCAGFVPVEDSINVVEQHQPDDIPAPFGFDLDPNSW